MIVVIAYLSSVWCYSVSYYSIVDDSMFYSVFDYSVYYYSVCVLYYI